MIRAAVIIIVSFGDFERRLVIFPLVSNQDENTEPAARRAINGPTKSFL